MTPLEKELIELLESVVETDISDLSQKMKDKLSRKGLDPHLVNTLALYPVHTQESILKIKQKRAEQRPPNLGKSFSEVHKNKLSVAHTGKKLSETHKQSIGDVVRGRPKPQITCPHCGKVGGAPQMHQWHFDNCRFLHYKINL